MGAGCIVHCNKVSKPVKGKYQTVTDISRIILVYKLPLQSAMLGLAAFALYLVVLLTSLILLCDSL